MSDKKYLDLTGVGNLITNIFSKFVKITDFNSHKNDTTAHMTSGQKSNLTTAYNHSQSSHAPTNAEKNTIVGIQKNGTDLTIDSTTRKVNITVPTKVSELTNDSGFKTSDSNTTYSLSKNGSTIILTGSDGKTTSVSDSNTTYTLGSFGISATATEINYVDGVTSNVQTQLNNKAAKVHSHLISSTTEPTTQNNGDTWLIK